jgi:fumarate hydratase, class II
MSQPTRTERDSMGEMQVPRDAYYSAQTARAVENFPISSLRLGRRFIAAMGLVKWAAAEINHRLGVLDAAKKDLIQRAAQEVIDGKLDDQFVVDVFQTGSGTSTNMNTNEVIASRANELATGTRGGKSPIHPNDHVNMQQSSNDVIPTAMHIAIAAGLEELIGALTELSTSLSRKAEQYDDVVKIGRTHLQDATPIRLGQELSGYAHQAHLAAMRAAKAVAALRELPLGGTAVGTGINSHPDFAKAAIQVIADKSGIDFVEAKNHFEAQAAKDAIVEASGQLKTIAISLTKIANDIRFLASGPRCGIGEISIPATQPGSSIMPGKVNPVMSEMLLQVCARAIGNDATVAFAGSALGSTFELNVMMPVMAYAMLESIDLLARGARQFAVRCADGIEANRERCESLVEQSLAMCTSLAPRIGYDAAADIAKESFKTGQTVRQIAQQRQVLPQDELARTLDPIRMTEPQPDMVGSGGG